MMDYPQQQYQSSPVSPNEIYANVMQEERLTNIISQTSPDNQLVEIEMRIRGYKKNNINKQWEPPKNKPNISDELVNNYIGFLGSILNDNTRFTNLSSTEINDIMNLVIEFLTDDLDANAELYGVCENYTERTRVGYIMECTVFCIFKRSQNGMEGKRIWNSIDLKENIGGMPQKKSFLDHFKIWKS